MKKYYLKIVLGILLSSAVVSSCKKDVEEPNDEEVITTMQLKFVPVGGGATLTYKFDDPDGPGGGIATQDEIVLAPLKTYNVTIALLNKTETPAEDITTEVAAEADAHRFYYEPTAGSNIAVTGLNNDNSGNPLGIESTWATSSVVSGKIKITLRHYPGTPPGKAFDDLVNNSKSGTDIEVEFDTKVQ